MSKIQELEKEIERKEKDMNEYWDELKKHDPLTYSYPFHQARAIEKLKKELVDFKNIKCPYCSVQDEQILPNGLCVYHNYFHGKK